MFPGESEEYRAARNRLLDAEIEARRAIERAAALRRDLPLGGAVPEDYVFDEAGGPVRLSELFGGHDTLLLYSFMFSEQPCPSCTSILDSLDGAAPHLARAAFGVVAKAPFPRLAAYGQERGWRHLRLLSSAANTYNRDYRAETAGGAQLPIMNVFTRREDEVRHFWASELAESDPGQEPRSLDLFWPLWHLLDATPAGRE
jgi:predicted dithiol-disulfide oxidoreductase (DUF899 family)